MPAPDNVAVQLDQADCAIAVPVVPNGAGRVQGDAVAMSVLAAVVEMALRSKRRQADLEAALCRAGIGIGRARVLEALDFLCRQRWVDGVVPLHDGGMLLSVTALGLEVAGRPRVT